jgi:hypothetical protein
VAKGVVHRIGDLCGGLGRLVIVGGAIRDLVLQTVFSKALPILDIDIVVLHQFDETAVIKGLGPKNCKRNTFGGIKWTGVEEFDVDVWAAPKQAEMLGTKKTTPFDVCEVLRLLDFNVNAGAYLPNSRAPLLSPLLNATQTLEIEFNNGLLGPTQIQLARILHLEWQLTTFGFSLSKGLNDWCKNAVLDLDSVQLATAAVYFERKGTRKGLVEPHTYFHERVRVFANQP